MIALSAGVFTCSSSLNAAAKHGVIGLTRSAALNYAEHPRQRDRNGADPERSDRGSVRRAAPTIINAVPVGRIGDPFDVATAAAWLCSDLATFVTGATVPVDGGRLALRAHVSHAPEPVGRGQVHDCTAAALN